MLCHTWGCRRQFALNGIRSIIPGNLPVKTQCTDYNALLRNSVKRSGMKTFVCGTHFVAQRPLVSGYSELIIVFLLTLLNVHAFHTPKVTLSVLYSVWQFAKLFGKQDSWRMQFQTNVFFFQKFSSLPKETEKKPPWSWKNLLFNSCNRNNWKSKPYSQITSLTN